MTVRQMNIDELLKQSSGILRRHRHYTRIDEAGHTVEVFEDSGLYVAYGHLRRFLVNLWTSMKF